MEVDLIAVQSGSMNMKNGAYISIKEHRQYHFNIIEEEGRLYE